MIQPLLLNHSIIKILYIVLNINDFNRQKNTPTFPLIKSDCKTRRVPGIMDMVIGNEISYSSSDPGRSS